MTRPPDPSAEARRRLIRHATIYTWGSIAAAVVIAVGGAALIAWMLRGTGWPFARLWVIITVMVLAPPLLAIIVRRLRRR